MKIAVSALVLLAGGLPASAQSAAARAAAREVMEAVERRFAREIAEEGVERLESRLAMALERWGDDAAAAARRVGPRLALESVERHGAPAARLLARFGDDGARLLAAEGSAALRAHAALGDEGIAMMLRRSGTEVAAAASRLAEPIAATGRGSEILAVLERYGDRGARFLWRNKGVIFGAAVLAAFLADPGPFLDGVRRLAEEPVREAARRTEWTAVALALVAAAALLAGWRMFLRRRTAGMLQQSA